MSYVIFPDGTVVGATNVQEVISDYREGVN